MLVLVDLSLDHIKLLRVGIQCFKREDTYPRICVFGESASVEQAAHPFSCKASVNRQLLLRTLIIPVGKHSRLIRTAGRIVTHDELPLLVLQTQPLLVSTSIHFMLNRGIAHLQTPVLSSCCLGFRALFLIR